MTVQAAAHDSGVAHETEAIIDVAEKSDRQKRRVAHIAINAVEPTIGGRRTGLPAETETYVEGAGIGVWDPSQTLQSVQTAFDQGNVNLELVNSRG